MKEFFKYMFASMLGFIIVLVIAFFLLVGFVMSMVSFAEKETVKVNDKTVLQLKLDKMIYDRAPKNPWMIFNPASFDSDQNLGLDQLLKSIKKAKSDDKIKGILLDLSFIPTGISTIEEIRNALLDFRNSGKFIISYGKEYSQSAYYLASVSDKVYLLPGGMIEFKGLSAQSMFLKGTLDKLDIDIQVIRHGKFKSAAEPFMYDKLSEYNREQIQALLDDIWNNILTSISEGRNVPVDVLKSAADNLDALDADKALSLKMVDGLFYRDQLLDEMRQRLSIAENGKINFLSADKYSDVPDKKKDVSINRIAVIYAIGSIGSGKGDDLTIGSDKMSETIREAAKNEKVKAIVLRVNSPGGDAFASEVIRREVELATLRKPVVVSMGDLAASGGYWISCSADTIIADPTTLTGSIGVFGLFPNFENFFKNKLGITFDYVKTNENAEFPTAARPLTGYQKMIFEREIDGIYKDFLKLVAEGRHMSTAQVDSIGQGRIWSAVAAKRLGLVDQLGGLDRAVEIAAEMAHLKDYSISSLPVQKDPWQQILESFTGEVRTGFVRNELGDYYKYFNYLKELSGMKGIQARMPYELTIQ
jgi:protease-4